MSFFMKTVKKYYPIFEYFSVVVIFQNLHIKSVDTFNYRYHNAKNITNITITREEPSYIFTIIF